LQNQKVVAYKIRPAQRCQQRRNYGSCLGGCWNACRCCVFTCNNFYEWNGEIL